MTNYNTLAQKLALVQDIKKGAVPWDEKLDDSKIEEMRQKAINEYISENPCSKFVWNSKATYSELVEKIIIPRYNTFWKRMIKPKQDAQTETIDRKITELLDSMKSIGAAQIPTKMYTVEDRQRYISRSNRMAALMGFAFAAVGGIFTLNANSPEVIRAISDIQYWAYTTAPAWMSALVFCGVRLFDPNIMNQYLKRLQNSAKSTDEYLAEVKKGNC